MKLSKRLLKWKANLTTQTSVEYILTLRADVNGFADEVKALERENAKLRELVQYIVDECYGDEWFYEQAESFGIEPDY